MHLPVTAIVTAYQRVDQTLTTLRILSECIPSPAEIIVHVDGNEVSTLEQLRSKFPEVRYLLSEENVGPGGGRNKLVKEATQPIVASFDDDSYPLDSDYFSRAIRLFESHPDASIITARVFHQGDLIEGPSPTLEWTSDFAGGACVYRRAAILSTTGYVPLTTAYGMEEVDLAMRLHAGGKQILATQWLRVFHDTDLKRHADPKVTSGSVANLFLLTYLRYPPSLWPIGLAQATRLILWLLTHGRHRGVLQGLLRVPAFLHQNHEHRQPLRRQAVRSYLSLRRNPRECSWKLQVGVPDNSEVQLTDHSHLVDEVHPPTAVGVSDTSIKGASIVLGYIGVHQIFELALAAHEAGQLEALHCSLVDMPGKWGHWLGKRIAASSLNPLDSEQLPPERCHETPFPLFFRQLGRFGVSTGPRKYHYSNAFFDQTLARRLRHSKARLFVGVETCALASLKAARQRSMKRILDCPGIPADMLKGELQEACHDLSLPSSASQYSQHSADQRAREIEEADLITLCSDIQLNYYAEIGIPPSKMRVNPLWVDAVFTGQPGHSRIPGENQPLRVLFVGNATIAKGAPYALEAMQLVGDVAKLTFCGGVDETVRRWAGHRLHAHTVLGWHSRSSLAEVYASHDVLLFPTLGDSFGFVALEAMACGLPVITTTRAGAPLPDESWRVPTRNAEALAQRILGYANDRERLLLDGHRAREFALTFTPASYRLRARTIFSELLGE
jgi:glycosyltransferase involved in cell wall biosynthesis